MNQSSSKFFTQIAVIVGFVLGVLGVIIFASSNFGSSDGDGKLTGTLMVWGTLPESKLSKSFYEYSQNAKTYTVKYSEVPENVFITKFIEATAKGEAPDIVLASENILFPLRNYFTSYTPDILTEKNYKDIFARNTYDFYGKNGTFILPVASDPLMMYVNTNIMQNAGFAKPLENWIDMPIYVKAVLDLNKTNNITELRAVAMGTFSNVLYAREILSTLLLQLNNNVVQRYFEESQDGDKTVYKEKYESVLGLKDGKRNIDNAGNAELVFNFFSSFVNPNLENIYTWSRRAPTDRDLFAAGTLGIYFGLASDKAYIDLKNPNLKYEIAMMPIPKSDSNKYLNTNYVKVYGLSMATKNSNITLSQKVMSDLSDTDFADKIINSVGIAPARSKGLAVEQSTIEMQNIYKSAERGKFILEPRAESIKKIFSETTDAFLGSRMTPVEIVGKAQDDLSVLVGDK
jgi:ABC-type glycerol-3-phosphate transport system substrate-binding protein